MRVTLTFNGLIGLPLRKPIIILSQTFYKNLWNKMKEKVLNDELFNMFRILKQHFFHWDTTQNGCDSYDASFNKVKFLVHI